MQYFRERIFKDSGITKIEEYMYEDHEMLRRAAVQCIANLMVADYVGIHTTLFLLL